MMNVGTERGVILGLGPEMTPTMKDNSPIIGGSVSL